MASLRFVHVMGGDEKGQALAGELMDLFPEIAPRLGVDAGRRFVQQQQLRAGGSGRPPAPGAVSNRRKAGRPVGFAPVPRPSRSMLSAHGLAAVVDGIDAGHEIEVFLDRQIFPKAEMLRHVADLALDGFALGDDVEAEAKAAALVRPQQAAEHANEGGLAAAVGAEKAADFARRDLQIDMIHAVSAPNRLVMPRTSMASSSGMRSVPARNSTSTGWPGCNWPPRFRVKTASIMKTSLPRLSWL